MCDLQYGLTVRIARIFNTYGPHMRPNDGRVVSNFIVQALAGEPISIYGDGSQTRSFCYVDDTITALLRLMEAPEDVCGPVNIGNPKEVSMHALAGMVRALTGSRSRIVHLAAVCDDPRRRRPDIALARRELDWSPQVGLHEGLERTIEYFRELLAGDTPD